MKGSISEWFFYKCFLCLSFFYLVYTLLLTAYDFTHLQHIQWKQAENQTTVYSSRRSTTVTYNFVKDNKVQVSREYPGIVEGLNTWLWRIDKKKDKEDISFYVRQKDYDKIINNQIKHRKDIFGDKLNDLESIPFLG